MFILLNVVALTVHLFVRQFFSFKWIYKLSGFTNGFIKFSLLTYPIRFLLENFMKLWGTFNIEANRLSGQWGKYLNSNHWNLENQATSSTNIVLINFSGFIILAYIGFEITLIIFSLNPRQPKISQNSRLSTFLKGLNLKRRLFPIIYFLHFLGLWLLLGFLILLTPAIKSYLLWILILSVQILCLFAHVFKLYEKCICYMLTILREIWLLFIVLYLFSL